MIRSLCYSLLLLSLIVGLPACNRKKDLKTGVDTSVLEKVFLATDFNTKSNVSKLVLAIKANNYVDSIFLLRRFSTDPGLTADQKRAVKNLMYTVQAILAEAVDKGDTNAQKAVEEYEQRTRGKAAE